jgi:NAD+ diphosphatase
MGSIVKVTECFTKGPVFPYNPPMQHNATPFRPIYKPGISTPGTGRWFLFHKGNLVLQRGNSTVPFVEPNNETKSEFYFPLSSLRRFHYLGTLWDEPCWSAAIDETIPPGDDWEEVTLRSAYGRISPEELQAARFASHLLYWDGNTRYCGACGNPTIDKPDERAKLCPVCGTVTYPRISPAVIVAILDGDRILLAHNRRFISKFYSLIAGFVEIGESLEDCVHREVYEEVGVTVKNLRYFGSQPWPTPDSLMLGFVAEYAGGEIRVQEQELYDARWFSPPDMPPLPAGDSIARKIIFWYENEHLPQIQRKRVAGADTLVNCNG